METYNPKLVNLVVDGRYATGFADGTFIAASKNEDKYIPNTGAHGDVVITESADETGTVTATLSNTSPTLKEYRRLAKNGSIVPIQIVDANTQTVRAGGTKAIILKVPDLEFGDEAGSTEVSFFVGDYSVD